ncbi:MAG: hypothetical protein LBG87_02230 [Spirochaetaceae bacterium]|nr:hypothetical protein [Spirochaetaceae bacterium]
MPVFIENGSISFITIAPTPITASSPIVQPSKIITFGPNPVLVSHYTK